MSREEIDDKFNNSSYEDLPNLESNSIISDSAQHFVEYSDQGFIDNALSKGFNESSDSLNDQNFRISNYKQERAIDEGFQIHTNLDSQSTSPNFSPMSSNIEKQAQQLLDTLDISELQNNLGQGIPNSSFTIEESQEGISSKRNNISQSEASGIKVPKIEPGMKRNSSILKVLGSEDGIEYESDEPDMKESIEGLVGQTFFGKKKKPNSSFSLNYTYLPHNVHEIYETRSNIEISLSNDKKIMPKLKLEDIGGLKQQIDLIASTINIQLNYPHFCEAFKLKKSSGFLFHGPPGTGKTSVAKALINEFKAVPTILPIPLSSSLPSPSPSFSNPSSISPKPLAYFQFTSSDILSKNIGESENRLVKIFEAAKKWQPSIIFFDEIDGLIPVRNERDRATASLVSTFLNLMDGLTTPGQLIIIGSTNRLSAIDPAMRRQGRFDHEIYFPLPQAEARRSILAKITKRWHEPPEDELLKYLAELTVGFSGADLRSLCTKASLISLNRGFPNLIEGEVQEDELGKVRVLPEDFYKAMEQIHPFKTLPVSSLPSASSTSVLNLKNLRPPSQDPVQLLDWLITSKVTRIIKYLNDWGSYLNPNAEAKASQLPRMVLLRGQDPKPLHHGFDQVIRQVDGYRIIEIDLYADITTNDRYGLKAISDKLNMLRNGERVLIVIRNADTFFDMASPRIIALFKIALNTACAPGKVAYLFTCKEYTAKLKWLRRIDWVFKMDIDQLKLNNLKSYLDKYFKIEYEFFKVKNEVDDCVIESFNNNLSEALDRLIIMLDNLTVQQVIDLCSKWCFKNMLNFVLDSNKKLDDLISINNSKEEPAFIVFGD